jgi:hypothetical protein
MVKAQEAEQTIQKLTEKLKRAEDANDALSQQLVKKPVVTQNSRRQLKEELGGMVRTYVLFRVLLC